MGNLINKINSPDDLKEVPIKDLPLLAGEIREKIIDVVSKRGGHLASSLGAVELAISLHYCFNMPKDKIIWDVGHQAYPHKILTGRAKAFDTLRQLGGISGFPSRTESKYDTFTCGHSSTSISTALGLACARDLKNETWKAIAVIGDASLANGMALEGLNHAGHMKKDIIVILNDNELSISRSVGALSRHLNRILANPVYNKVRRQMQILVKRIPIFGFKTFRAARKLEESLKNLLIPGMFFEGLGFRYFGPINGHDINELITMFRNIASLREPIVVHVVTKKGKGYKFSEEKPSLFHGTPPFDAKSGKALAKEGPKSFTEIFSDRIVELARKDKRIVAITAAMPDGTGLAKFSREFPNRFFDVGIAEEHAVAFSAGLAHQGLRPIVAIYSTFLQRGYDQIIHDVSLQNLPVVFCLDRAGLAGEDGPTHHGVFDIAYLRHIPNLVVMAPRDGLELGAMLEFAVNLDSPVAIRYPKGSAQSHLSGSSFEKIELGKSQTLRKGRDIAIFAIGSMVSVAVKAADLLSADGIEATVVNARFVKPLDKEIIENLTKEIKKVVTLEEGVATGGFGSVVLEFFERENIENVKIERLGLPDQFIAHGKREELLKEYHLTADEICETIKNEFFEKKTWQK
ncbi:MAG: 1-deoxy-D-xylulose-5-phosphate synthase [Candidatus Omnitrophica bacterium]|nr:1-deoxy-D-xylulose-5-phosphate synthase [Candidatus Omnitrophota bacterium]